MSDSYTVEVKGVGSVLIERSSRAKRMNITVRPFKGVRVAVPFGMTFLKAETFMYSRKDWICSHLDKTKKSEKRLNNQPPGIPMDQAKGILINLVEEMAREHGFKYNQVSVKSMKTRWGSCSAKNNINLNVRILRLPQEIRDYVILHELVHTEHRNHSSLFWARLSDLCGNAKALQSRLRRYGEGGI